MSISPEEVPKFAHLARLGIEPDAIAGYAQNLSQIMALVAQMDEVDTQGVEPMAHPQDLVQRLRVDVVTEGNQRDSFQAVAPQTEAGLYLVPQVIE